MKFCMKNDQKRHIERHRFQCKLALSLLIAKIFAMIPLSGHNPFWLILTNNSIPNPEQFYIYQILSKVNLTHI